nr:hypothetical protein [Tanacetum cinerariifolium]
MNMSQDRQTQNVGGNGGNQFRQYAGQVAHNQQGIGNQSGFGNVVAARAEDKIEEVNANCILMANLQHAFTSGTQLDKAPVYDTDGSDEYTDLLEPIPEPQLVPQNDNHVTSVAPSMVQSGEIQLQAEEYDLMAAAANLDEIKKVNANCILMANLQQASSSGTQNDSTPVYDSDGSAEVHENCNNNEIFNMFTQEEQYTKLLEPIPKPQQVPQNDNVFISEVTGMEQDGEIVEQHSANFKETRALYESLYHNLAVEVEKVNSVNRKLKETNADLTTELARNNVTNNDFERTDFRSKQTAFKGKINSDLDEIKEVNVNCILMANLQQASTSGTQIDKSHVYDSDGSAE